VFESRSSHDLFVFIEEAVMPKARSFALFCLVLYWSSVPRRTSPVYFIARVDARLFYYPSWGQFVSNSIAWPGLFALLWPIVCRAWRNELVFSSQLPWLFVSDVKSAIILHTLVKSY